MDQELKQYLDAKFAELHVKLFAREATSAELKVSPRMAAFLVTDRTLEALSERVLKGWEEKIKRGQTI
jgi:hypothetical protein